ncbi:MAG: hypothetical protein JWM97_2020 [Phycisphaerales bacterium]|nr:hypothetical protein [Phycisphaerales bacterium]
MVVYTNDPLEKAALLAKGGGYTDQIPYGSRTRALIHSPVAWQRCEGVLQFGGIAFLHRLKSPGGNVRLVAIELSPSYSVNGNAPKADTLGFNARVSEPATLVHDKRLIFLRPNYNLIDAYIEPGDRFRLLAGQPDPSDASRFTISYTFNGAPGAIDGQLRDDDTVTLKPRTGAPGPGAFWQLRPPPAATMVIPSTPDLPWIGPAGPPAPVPTERLPLVDENQVRIPYNKFVLLRRGERTIALRMRADPKQALDATYEWFDLSTGVGPATRPASGSPLKGHGRTSGSALISAFVADSLLVLWSPCTGDSGWIGFPGDAPPLAVSATAWETFEEIKPSGDPDAWLTAPDKPDTPP